MAAFSPITVHDIRNTLDVQDFPFIGVSAFHLPIGRMSLPVPTQNNYGPTDTPTAEIVSESQKVGACLEDLFK